MIPKRGAPLPSPDVAAPPTQSDVAAAKKRANADTTPAGRSMLDATELPEDEQADRPIPDE
jgi:hypothetical protein